MPFPIIEQIAVLIEERLATITIDPGGYETDVSSVVRPTRIGIGTEEFGSFQIIVLQENPTRDLDGEPMGHEQWIQPFALNCIIETSDRTETEVEQILNPFRADVEKATQVDVHWTDGSGTELAIDTLVRAPEAFVTTDGGFEGITVNIDVIYRTLVGDPYSL